MQLLTGSRRKKVIVTGAACGAVLGSALLWWVWSGATTNSEYVIARFRTGDIYFGQLRWFPRPRLERAWMLERGMNGDQPVTSVNQISKAPWKPLDVLYFNPAELSTWSPLAPDSPFMAALKDPSSLERPLMQGAEAEGR